MAKVLFLQRDGYESFGVMYLAAALAARGHGADVLVESQEKASFYDKARALRPDVVAFSLMTGLEGWAAQAASRVKAAWDGPVVAGGPHATFFPEFVAEPGLDAVCRGEAEDALPEFVDALAGGGDGARVPGFWVKAASGLAKNDLYPLRADLDSLPLPDRGFYRRRYPELVEGGGVEVLAARGCPFSCSFCYNHVLRRLYAGKGRYVRRHGHDRLLEEIARERRERPGGVRYVGFVDDLFIQDRDWLEGFLARYRAEIGLPFTCAVRANLVDAELVRELAASGCKVVSFGLESGDERLRNEVLGKKISEEQILRTAELLTAHGIRFSTFNMFNLPGETLALAEKTLALNLRLGPANHPWSGLLQPYRGTRVFDHIVERGLASGEAMQAGLFHQAVLRQPDTEALTAFNACFYWMVRLPRWRRPLFWLARHGGGLAERFFGLAASLHRYVRLMEPLEGGNPWLSALRLGWRRLRAYL